MSDLAKFFFLDFLYLYLIHDLKQTNNSLKLKYIYIYLMHDLKQNNSLERLKERNTKKS